MRRALAALAALLLAAPAFAGRTIVVSRGQPPEGAATVSAGIAEAMERNLELFRTLGMDFDVLRANNVKTEWARTLVFPDLGGTTKSYVAGVVNEFSSGTQGSDGTRFVPDSLSLQARWPVGPWVLLAPPLIAGTLIFAPGGSPVCSLGIAANPAPSGIAGYELSDYVPGKDWFWHTRNSQTEFTPTAIPAAGVFRAIVKQAPSGWLPYVQQSPAIAPANWDSLPSGGVLDTVAVFARLKKNGAGPPIVGVATGISAVNWPIMRTVIGLALADSFANQAMLGQTSELPVRFNIQFGPLCATGMWNDRSEFGLDEGLGPYPGDDAAWKSSLASFEAMGLKGTVLVQTDSMGAFPDQAAAVRDLWPQAHVSPFNKTGVWASQVGGGNATAEGSNDTFGATRLRSLLPAGCADPRDGCSQCAADTASVFCKLQKAFAKLTTYYGASRVDRVIACPLEDFTPTYFGEATGSMDSLKWVLYLAGVTGVRVGNMTLENDVGAGGAGNPRGWRSALSVESVRDPATGLTVGRIVFMPSRDSEDDIVTSATGAHDLQNEFLNGLFQGDWYLSSRSPVYAAGHNFFSRTVIFEIPGNWLGGSALARGNWRTGYWFARSLWAQCQAANSFGRMIVEPSYGDETAEWVMRSRLH